MNLDDMLKSMGMNPDDLNENQKAIFEKAQDKINQKSDKEKSTDWIREKYSGLFPIWK